MFDIGFSEMVLLAAIALVAIGPKQLPEVARTVGRMLNELKRATGDLTKTVLDARDSTTKVLSSTMDELNQTANSINHSLIEPTKIESGHHDDQAHAHLHDGLTLEEPNEEQLSLLDQPQVDKKDV